MFLVFLVSVVNDRVEGLTYSNAVGAAWSQIRLEREMVATPRQTPFERR
jgi:hypothetical protein